LRRYKDPSNTLKRFGQEKHDGRAEGEHYVNIAVGGSRRRAGNIRLADDVVSEKTGVNSVTVGVGELR